MSKKTVDAIIAGGNDYIVSIKGNQPTLQNIAIEIADSQLAIDSDSQSECLHGRSTTRAVKVYQIESGLLPDWAGAKSLIEVERSGTRIKGKKSRRQLVDYYERHFYLSSLDESAVVLAAAIRGHWSIENQLHWVKDVTLNEDNSVYLGGNSTAAWAMVRQFLVSVARQFPARTFPDALRTMANEVRQVFNILFSSRSQSP